MICKHTILPLILLTWSYGIAQPVSPMPETKERDDFFVQSFSSFNIDYPENVEKNIRLTIDMLTNDGIEESARKIKEELDKKAEGRRMVFVWGDITHDIVRNSENYLWWDTGVAKVQDYVSKFFAELHRIGGEVDFVLTDFEHELSIWNMFLNYTTKDAQLALLTDIQADPRFAEIKIVLQEKGFDFDNNDLSSILEWQTSKSYLIWNGAMEDRRGEYLSRAVFEPLREVYPNVKFSNYNSKDITEELGFGENGHNTKLYRGQKKVGTHSSPVAYGGVHNVFLDDGTSKSLKKDAYMEMLYAVNEVRSSMLSTENYAIMPWITVEDWETVNYMGGTPYYDEYIFHIGLCNPDPFLFFGAQFYVTDDPSAVKYRSDKMASLLEELNLHCGYKNRRTLVTQNVDFDSDFVLTGMEFDNHIVWRISPNMNLIDGNDINNFLIDEENPTFKINESIIQFDGGLILPNLYSSYGFWVITNKDVLPEFDPENNETDDDPDEEETDDDPDEEETDNDPDEEETDDDSDEEETDDVSNEITNKQFLHVYAKDCSVYVVSVGAAIQEIKIYNLHGMELYQSKINDTSHMVSKKFVQGVYIVAVKTDNGIISKKLIIN